MSRHLASILARRADDHPDKALFVTEEATYTYGAFASAAARLARLFRAQGLGRGSVAGLLVADPPLLVAGYFACAAIGAAAIALHPDTLPPTQVEILTGAKASHLAMDANPLPALAERFRVITLPPLVELAGPPRVDLEPEAPETCVMAYATTSGTTGRPKYVMTSTGAYAGNALAYAQSIGATEEDVFFGALPLSHGYGLTVCILPPIFAGATVGLQSRFSPRPFLEFGQQLNPTVVVAVPAMYDLLSRFVTGEPPKMGFTRARLFLWGSAPCAPSLIKDYRDRFGIFLNPSYGSNEMLALTTSTEPDFEVCAETVGSPVEGTKLWTVDPVSGERLPEGAVGEVVATGPGMALGYLDDPVSTAETFRDGACHTGDLGRLDSAGRLRLTGRKKRMFKRGAHTIIPEEVERALEAIPGVSEAVVSGRSTPSGNDVLVALVSVTKTLTKRKILDRLGGSLETYKHPQVLEIVEALPRNERGKVDRAAVEAMVDAVIAKAKG